MKDLRKKAQEIRRQKQVGKNTSELVGGLLENIVDAVDELEVKKKGYFSTVDLLTTKYPNPQEGWYAYVGANHAIWEVNKSGVWEDTKTTLPPEQTKGYAAEISPSGESVVYGSVATQAVEAQKDKLVNVGLMNGEIDKLHWHAKNIDESYFTINGFWSKHSGAGNSGQDSYIRTPLFRVREGMKFLSAPGITWGNMATAVFFDRNNKFIGAIDPEANPKEKVNTFVAPPNAYSVGFSKYTGYDVEKVVYVSHDFWAMQDDNLLAEYVHSGNKETYVESIDYETNTFYAPDHGLSEGSTGISRIGVSISNGENIYPYNVMPFLELPYYGFHVANLTKDTFQLVLEKGGEPIKLVKKDTIDLTKWKFESNTAHNVTFSNLPLPPDGSFVMDIIGQCVFGYSYYWGRTGFRRDFIKYNNSTYGYDNIEPSWIPIPFFGGHIKIEERTSNVGGSKLITASTLLYGKVIDRAEFHRSTHSYITRKINKSSIGLANTLIANGTVVRIYKL